MERVNGTVLKAGALALALALAGCGGGGGGSTGTGGTSGTGGTPAAGTPSAGTPSAGTPAAGTPAGDTQAQRTVQGTAAKGLIKGATVSLYAIDDQGVRGTTALATATTAADGTYKLQIPSTVQNFVIEVTAAPGATMADEATGTDIALPADMKLRSVVTLAAGASGTYEGTVSPLTEMVARTAETADGKLPKAAVAQAKIEVSSLLGFNPETVKPVNSNSDKAAEASEDEKNQSLALAAISQMASSVTADCAQGVPGERISCVVKQLAGSVKVKDGKAGLDDNKLSAFRDALKTVAEDKKINHTGKDKVVGIPVVTTPGTTVPATPANPASAVDATKALFKSLRTNVQALGSDDAFRATADGIKSDLNADLLPLSNDVGSFATLAVNALAQLDRYNAGESKAQTFQVWQSQLYAGDTYPIYYIGNGSGNCAIKASPLSITCTTVELYSVGDFSSPNGSTRDYVTRTATFTKSGTGSGYTYAVSFVKNTANYDRFYTWTGGTSSPIAGSYSGNITFSRSGNLISQLALEGVMPGRLDESGIVRSGAETWSLNATRTEEGNGIALYKFGGLFTANSTGTATQRGQVTGQVEIDKSSFVRLAMDGNGNVSQNPANEAQVTLRGTLGTTTVDGTLNVSGDKQDKSKTLHMPTKLSFNGSLKHKDATVFTGKVAIVRGGFENFNATAPESDKNFVADTVELGGTLSVPNRPALSLTLGLTRTGASTADISAQYRDGTSVINASVSAKAGDTQPLVKVSSADGVAFSFKTTDKQINVTKDGANVALLDLKKGRIDYQDGSFESIK